LPKKALEYFPSDAELYFYLGVVYNQFKKLPIGYFNFGKRNYLGGRQTKTLKGQYYSNLGEAYNSVKDYKKFQILNF